MAVAGPRDLWIYSPNGARLHRRSPAPGRTYDGLAWSPSTRQLAVVVRDGDREILRVGSRVLARGTFLTDPRWSPDGRWIVVSRGRERWSFFRTDGGAARHVRGAAAIAGWTTAAGR